MMTSLLSTYVANYVEFRQSNENLKLILIWNMFVLCDRHWGINQRIPEASGLCH